MPYFTIKKQDDIAVVLLNQPNSPVNVLSTKMLSSFATLMDTIEQDNEIKAAIFYSQKPDCWVAGADIKEFMAMKSSDEAQELSRGGNKLLSRLANLKKPIIAAINGATLGGGLEFAMACHYRIASTDKKTVFGLPEVKLGLLPGGGGTQRTVQLVGLRNALDMLLTGKNVYPYKAKKIGLVDELIHKEGLLQAAIKVAQKGFKKRSRKKGMLDKVLEGTSLGRNFVLKKARETVTRKTRGNYPAPLKILDCVEIGLDSGMAAGLEAESAGFAYLHSTEACKSLIALFIAMGDNKKLKSTAKTHQVHDIAMIGAGFMGAGITEVSIKAGYNIVLKDISLVGLGSALRIVWNDFNKLVKRKAMGVVERDMLMAKITTTVEDSDLKNTDLVIEAVFEDIGLKQKILANIEATCKSNTIFATNTSSLPIADIAANAKHPTNIIGMHYFSPVPKMPLLEIIVTNKTSARAIAIATNVGIAQGKTVVVVKDGPGFYTTRILSALTHEALQVLKAGASIEAIDNAMKDWGFPVGPLSLLDEVGIDVAAHIARGDLGKMFKDRGIEKDDSIQKLADAKLFGRKTSKGFYIYPKKGRKTVNKNIYKYFGSEERKDLDKTTVQNQIGLAMVNEALLCLQEGIISSAADGDLAAILGLGFPPFTGGPFSYINAQGASEILTTMKQLHAEHGIRFKPADILVEYAETDKVFI
ncbi:Enoyl-CoA hydratase / Delta(3)-cis-delta(2)-trans-enoyl-CoA isomerase / 3-hydroxyacyl-CoA dehydrogenase / 3-hydroxybutyryl-CoA epimerase [hydrothermal vent metagenome]|uniref:enoyl-CoA hydratase n=1 Tax=hydrothermal vent metagenome TaxID=652676 RepID=A0A3B0UWA4_9ZZZZ